MASRHRTGHFLMRKKCGSPRIIHRWDDGWQKDFQLSWHPGGIAERASLPWQPPTALLLSAGLLRQPERAAALPVIQLSPVMSVRRNLTWGNANTEKLPNVPEGDASPASLWRAHRVPSVAAVAQESPPSGHARLTSLQQTLLAQLTEAAAAPLRCIKDT